MSLVSLPAKVVADRSIYTFDFASSLAVGETISTQAVVCSVYSGVDPSPSSIISGAASKAGSIVSQLIIAGIVGVMYQLVCTVTTSGGQTLTLTGLLAIVPPST